MFESRRESRSNSFSKSSEVSDLAVMEPVEVKIKTFPRKLPHYGTLNKSEEIHISNTTENKDKEVSSENVPEEAKNDEKNAVFTAEPAIIIDVVDADSSSGNSKGNV